MEEAREQPAAIGSSLVPRAGRTAVFVIRAIFAFLDFAIRSVTLEAARSPPALPVNHA
jgi:hypothetical protein